MILKPEHLAYLKERGANPERLAGRYFSADSNLCIRYCDPKGQPYKDCKGGVYVIKRPFPTTKPKFVAPTASGSRPYFSPLMPDGYLENINIPLVLIEGPVKVDSCYEHIPTGYCFVGLTGTWNTKDRRDEKGTWHQDHDTRILPELRAIPMNGRKTITLFDSDIEDKPGVSNAAADIGNWTRQRGAKPHRCVMPSEPDGAKNGADDFLVRHGADALVEHLESAVVEGWPLPATLLDGKGELKRSYTPSEERRLYKSLAEINDVQTVDCICRALSVKLRIGIPQLLAGIDDVRAGTSEEGFLGTEDDLLGDDDIDSSWVIPYLLPKEETIVLSADPGTGKSLFCYSIAHAVATGTPFLGFPIAKGVPLILQLEEGGTFKRRVKAIGLARSEFAPGLSVGKEWFFSKTFDLAKHRHVEQLKLLIRNNVDLVIVDSARAVARSLSVDENHADFGKLVIRKIAKFVNDCGKAGIIVHHNNGSGKASGTKDTPAGVWGLFNLKAVEGDEELRTLTTDKKRETSVTWQLRLQRAELIDGLPNGWRWSLEADLSHMAPDQKWRDRFQNLLRLQTQPITLREAGQLMALGEDQQESMRVSITGDTACARWLVVRPRKGIAGRYFMPHEYRMESTHLEGNPEKQEGVETRDSHPPLKRGETLQVGVNPSSGQGLAPVREPVNHLKSVSDGAQPATKGTASPTGALQAEAPVVASDLPQPVRKTAKPIGGVSLSSHPPQENGNFLSGSVPTLNGHTEAFWKVVEENPGALPVTIANRFYTVTKHSLTGQQVKGLIAQGQEL